jgi:hypothetical protein
VICTPLARRQLLSAAGSIWYLLQTYRSENSDDGAELRPLWCAGHRLGQSSYKLSPSNQMADGKEHAVGHLLESSFR